MGLLLGLLGLWVSFTFAIEMPIYIAVPESVAADSPIEASLTAEVHNGDTTFCNAFRVYLATSYENKAHYFYHSDCYLIHEQTLCDSSIEVDSGFISYQNTTFTVTIPTAVGPSGRHYVLIAQTLQTDGSYYGASLESDVFDLTGANGTWSKTQMDGYTLWGDDGTACSGFACVKNCSDNSNEQKRQAGNSSNTAYDDCANACPNVSIDFEGSTRGGQPTTSLTTPSPCSIRASASAIDATTTPEVTGINPASTPTRSRSAAAAAGTSAAMSRHDRGKTVLTCSMFVATLLFIG